MTNRLSIIGLFALATLLATGGVEIFYHTLNQALTVEKQPATAEATGLGPMMNRTAASASTQTSKSTGNRKDYTIIAKRSLFGKIKADKKEKVAPASAPVLETTSLDLVLLGTISGDANEQRAIIKNKRKKNQDIYYQGDAIGPALIKEILRGKVILTVKGKDEILLMKEPKSPPSLGKAALRPPSARDYVAQEPEPVDEEVIDEEVTDEEELMEDSDAEQESPLTGDEVENETDEQNPPLPGRPSATPRKVSFKKKPNQVVEP